MDLILILSLPFLLWMALGVFLLAISSMLSHPQPLKFNFRNLWTVMSRMNLVIEFRL